MSSPPRPAHQNLTEYYKDLHSDLQKLLDVDSQPGSIKNRAKSYLVTLLRGNQNIRQMPKDLKGRIGRQLRLLAIDRSLSESMFEFSEEEKGAMNEYANKINEERDRETNFGDALRDLVRLARLNNITREQQSRHDVL